MTTCQDTAVLREHKMILDAAEPHSEAIAFTSETQPRLGENQHLLNGAPPALCASRQAVLTSTASNLQAGTI